MNIFVVSQDPMACAQALDDKRLVKMVLETAQIISTALWFRTEWLPPELSRADLYRKTHANHPCVLWARESKDNLAWLARLFDCLALEYSYRFKRIHASWAKFKSLAKYLQTCGWRPVYVLEFVNCTPHKDIENVFTAYRLTLIEKWQNDKVPPSWTGRQQPTWINEEERYRNEYNRIRIATGGPAIPRGPDWTRPA